MSTVNFSLTVEQAMVVMVALEHWSVETKKHAVSLEEDDLPGFRTWNNESAVAKTAACYIRDCLINRSNTRSMK